MRASKLLPPVLFGALFVGGLAVIPTLVRGQTITWARVGTDFNTGSNWNGGIVPGPSNTANFTSSASSAFQPTLSTSTTIANLTFTNTSNTGYVISGAPGVTLTLSSPGIDMTGFSGSTHQINVPVIFTGTNATITTSVMSNLEVPAVPNYADKNSPGIVFNDTLTALSLTTLDLSGRVTLNGAGNYSGTTNFGSKASYTTIGQPNAFGTSTLVVSGGSHTLQTVYDFSGTNKVANAISLINAGALTIDATKLELGGNISVSGTSATLKSNGTLILSGVISGNATVVSLGGTIQGGSDGSAPLGAVITGANTFTGNVSLNGGVSVSTIGNAGDVSPLGKGSSISLNSGRLIYRGTGETTDRAVSLTSNDGAIGHGTTSSVENWGTGPLVLNGTITPQGLLRTLMLGGDNSGANRIVNTFVNTVSASIDLIKVGAGLWNVPGNVGAGRVTVYEGTLRTEGSGTLSTSTLEVRGALDLNGTAQSVTGVATIFGGVVSSTGGGGMLTASSFYVGSPFSSDSNSTLSTVLAGSGGLTLHGGATLSALNTYTGKTVVEGTMIINSIANVGGGASSLGAPTTVGNGTIDLNGILRYYGPATSTDRAINLTGSGGQTGSSIDSIGTGPLTLNGAVTSSGSKALVYTLAGGTQGNTINGVISDGGFPISVSKAGPGSWTLTATNTFSGGTSISEGLLVAQASQAFGTGALSVSATGALGITNPGGGSIGTLTVSSFTWSGNGSSKLYFDLGAAGTSDQLAITTTFIKGTGSLPLVFDFQSGGTLGTTYTLLTFGSTSGFTDASPFAATNLASGLDGTFALSPTALTFTVTAIPEPATYAAIFGGVALLGAVCWRRRQR